ncbi:SAM domain-containing protein [Roseomonas rosulenta]|uniref:hypothetical protein n=1 Tax=Roseomonas rosulenta TaxID=2748667 RepID=UPI0018DFFD24|nr:hypothetical protein [Roseomonas rosulenta]
MHRYDPTPDQRRTVKTMAGFGVPHVDIATFLGIDAKTLRKHFREELDRGTTEANAKVAQSLFQMATQGKNVAAAIFWMKARGGWREKHEVEATVKAEQRYVISAPPRLSEKEWLETYAPKHLG